MRRCVSVAALANLLVLLLGRIAGAGMPFTVEASTATQVTLAAMHVVSGAVWFGAVRGAVASATAASSSGRSDQASPRSAPSDAAAG